MARTPSPQSVEQRFNAAFPHYNGQFARVIDFQVEYTQSLIDDFSNANKSPHTAISRRRDIFKEPKRMRLSVV